MADGRSIYEDHAKNIGVLGFDSRFDPKAGSFDGNSFYLVPTDKFWESRLKFATITSFKHPSK
jgi:hypothetical protein